MTNRQTKAEHTTNHLSKSRTDDQQANKEHTEHTTNHLSRNRTDDQQANKGRAHDQSLK